MQAAKDEEAMPPPACLPMKALRGKPAPAAELEKSSSSTAPAAAPGCISDDDGGLPEGFFDDPSAEARARGNLALAPGLPSPDVAPDADSPVEGRGSIPEMFKSAAKKAEEEALAAAEAEAQPQLPEGFFDDPDLDAKARGQEKPSEVAKRELEVELKKFEKEMAVVQEDSEIVRHEMDEEKYEKAAAEEDHFQEAMAKHLQGLRKKTEKAKTALQPSHAPAPKPAPIEDDEKEIESDEEVDFDWRAKGFL